MASDSRSPDDRPPPATPNWLTGVVLPKIASGAAGLLSSFIHTQSSSSYSSSSEDIDDIDSSPVDENDNPYITNDGVDWLNKEDGSTSEYHEGLRKESQLTIGKSETKHHIERLILKETFSREERDSLLSLINSRVIESSAIDKGIGTRSDIPDFCSKAMIEAKQWIEGKKMASNSKLKVADGTSTRNSIMLFQDNEGGLSSPVDMAKSYMRDRPPWSSLSLKSAGDKTPSPLGREFPKDETPYGSHFSSSKRKFSSLSSGSWNIQDEIRRVRSKATEDILKSVGASSDLVALGVGTSGYLSASAVDTTQEKSQTKDLQLQPVTLVQLQSFEDIQMVQEDKHAAHGSLQSAIPEPVLNDELRLTDKSCPITDRVTESIGKSLDCGFTLSGARVENDHRSSNDKSQNAVSSSLGKAAGSDRREEICELLSETLVEVPCMGGVDDVAMDNSNKDREGPSKVLTRTQVKQVVKGKSTANDGKGVGKKWSRYSKKTKAKD